MPKGWALAFLLTSSVSNSQEVATNSAARGEVPEINALQRQVQCRDTTDRLAFRPGRDLCRIKFWGILSVNGDRTYVERPLAMDPQEPCRPHDMFVTSPWGWVYTAQRPQGNADFQLSLGKRALELAANDAGRNGFRAWGCEDSRPIAFGGPATFELPAHNDRWTRAEPKAKDLVVDVFAPGSQVVVRGFLVGIDGWVAAPVPASEAQHDWRVRAEGPPGHLQYAVMTGGDRSLNRLQLLCPRPSDLSNRPWHVRPFERPGAGTAAVRFVDGDRDLLPSVRLENALQTTTVLSEDCQRDRIGTPIVDSSNLWALVGVYLCDARGEALLFGLDTLNQQVEAAIRTPTRRNR
jgi:hypothetical protein